MTHKFDVSNKNKLDNPLRRQILPAFEILKMLQLNEGDTFADIGCGIGYFTIPAAGIIGSKGIVYALDIELEMLEEMDKKAVENGIQNIRTIVTKEYDFKIPDVSVAFAFVCTVLHEVEDKLKFIAEAKRILKENGRLAIVEWIKRDSQVGPPLGHRLDMGNVEEMLKECGFQEIVQNEFNENFYIVSARKSDF